MLCRYARFGFGAAAVAGVGGPEVLFNAHWCCVYAKLCIFMNKEVSCECMAGSLEC